MYINASQTFIFNSDILTHIHKFNLTYDILVLHKNMTIFCIIIAIVELI